MFTVANAASMSSMTVPRAVESAVLSMTARPAPAKSVPATAVIVAAVVMFVVVMVKESAAAVPAPIWYVCAPASAPTTAFPLNVVPVKIR